MIRNGKVTDYDYDIKSDFDKKLRISVSSSSDLNFNDLDKSVEEIISRFGIFFDSKFEEYIDYSTSMY